MAGGEDVGPLLLRPWAVPDAEGLREAVDEEVSHLKPWLSWTLDEPASREGTRERLRRWVEDFRLGRGFRWAVTRPERPASILGGASLNRRVGPDAHDVGYWVRASATRRGIAAAAVSRLLVHAFEDRGVGLVVAQCDVANEASGAFATALGFTSAGETVNRYPDGSPRPVERFEMRRAEYIAEHGRELRRRARRVRLMEADGSRTR